MIQEQLARATNADMPLRKTGVWSELNRESGTDLTSFYHYRLDLKLLVGIDVTIQMVTTMTLLRL